eukprot:5697269-Prymnesium_polylepis.1
MGKLHNDKDAKGSLATFMQQSPERLAIGLKVRVWGRARTTSALVFCPDREYTLSHPCRLSAAALPAAGDI